MKIGMRPPHPSTFIREEILDELGLSVARAAEILKVRQATLSDLLNGKAALSPEMALRIEKAFGVNMDTLLRMQAWHDSYCMRQRAQEIGIRMALGANSSDLVQLTLWEGMKPVMAGLVVGAAQLQDCVVLLTEDLQDGMAFGTLAVRSPFSSVLKEPPAEYSVPRAHPLHRPRGRPRRAAAV